MRQQYQDINFRPSSLRMIAKINKIIAEYIEAGYKLTVRQLYYQLVARGEIENTQRSYKSTASLVNDARIAGLVDWDAIEDRTRDFITRSRWASGKQILKAVAQQFHMDMWEGQDRRVFVIVEKEALVGVLESVCHEYDVPLLAARGYPSASVMREFCKEVVIPTCDEGQDVLILHLGDHDPSGIDMTRDIEERVRLLSEHCAFDLRRIALNMDQIEELNPPPNPAKVTDSRFEKYQELHGDESWELDALPPDYISRLVRGFIAQEIDNDVWQERRDKIGEIRNRISKVADKFKD
jgi:DNA topoisomerase VI subunit A